MGQSGMTFPTRSVCALTVGHGNGTRDGEERVPAYQANEVDPTGAGDVFATAFFVRLHETGDAVQAARFANAAASFVVEGPGVSCIPSRAQVEWRLRYGRLV